MSPEDDERRRRRREDPFDAIDDLFEQMGLDPGEFDRMFRDIQRSFMDAMRSGGGIEPGKPFVTGFSFKMGPDGRPRIENFGNRPTRAKGGMPHISEEREPITDLVEDESTIAVTMEIPGVEKKDIHIQAHPDSLEISVDNEARKYHKTVKLPAEVQPETAKATYKNGVLDVTLQRTAQRQGGYQINVE
jgi:HSP20 family protein